MSEDLRELKLRKKQYDQYFSGLLNKHIEEGLDHDLEKMNIVCIASVTMKKCLNIYS